MYPRPVLLPQRGKAGVSLLTGLLDLLPALGLCLFQLGGLPVRKGLDLGQVEEGLQNFARRPVHRLVPVLGEGVALLHAVDVVQHVRDVLQLIRRVGLSLRVEELRPPFGQILIHLVDVRAAFPKGHSPEVVPPQRVVVPQPRRVLLADGQLGPAQVVPQLTVLPVEAVVGLHGAVHQHPGQFLRPPPGLGPGQLVPAVPTGAHVIVQALEPAGEVGGLQFGAVGADKLPGRPVHRLPVHRPRRGAPGLSFPLLHPLLQPLVLPPQLRQLRRVLAALQGETSVDICAGFGYTGLRGRTTPTARLILGVSGILCALIFLLFMDGALRQVDYII